MLYQLSYIPKMVEAAGVEPASNTT